MTIVLREKELLIFTNFKKDYLLNLDKENINDYSNKGHYGTGDVQIKISSLEDAKSFIKMIN